MGAVLGLAFAVGAMLVVLGLTTAAPRRHAPLDLGGVVRGAAIATAVGATAGTVAFAVTGVGVVGLLAAVAAAVVPSLLRRRRASQRRQLQQEAWPDAVDGLLGAVRAGVPLSEAMCDTAADGPEPLRAGFAAYARAWRRGASSGESLRCMQRYFADPSADRVVASLALAAESGGENVGRVLATQGDFLRADLRLRKEIEARQSWTVNGARVAVAAPWLAVALMSVRGESASAYSTGAGSVVLLATAGLCLAAYWAMTRIASLPRPGRLPEVGS